MIRSRIPLTALLCFLVLPACAKRTAQAAETPPSAANSLESAKTSKRLSLPPAEPEPVLTPVAQPMPAPVAPPTPTPPPALEPGSRPTDVSVTGYETGGTSSADGHVGDPRTMFAPAETVHLAVLAEGAARAIKLNVTWLGPDGMRLEQKEQEVTLSGPLAVPFALSESAGLAVGAYKAEIRLDGWLASTATFEVR